MAFDYEQYLRMENFPHILCAGCGHGIILKAILRAVHNMGWDKNDIVMVSGIGCSSRIPGYVDFNTLHTTHGRALGFATGIKMANSKLHVIAVGGDGDMTAIGGNHFIHACRRNIDMTLIMMNNFIYGMTGGQQSPTTPEGYWASTAPYGMMEPPFDSSAVAIGAGATFVARTTSYHAAQMEKLITEGFKHKGFSFIEAMSGCPTGFGRKNKLKSGVDILRWFKDKSITSTEAQTKTKEELKDKFITGVLFKGEKTEFVSKYEELIAKVKMA